MTLNLNDFYNENGSTPARTIVTTRNDNPEGTSGTSLTLDNGTITLYVDFDSNYSHLYISETSDEYVSIDDFGENTLLRNGYTFVNFTLGEEVITNSTAFNTD